MEMEKRLFFFLSRQIDRIHAEDNIRQMQILASVTSEESFKEVRNNQIKVMGDIYEINEPTIENTLNPDGTDGTFDRSGLEKLRLMSLS